MPSRRPTDLRRSRGFLERTFLRELEELRAPLLEESERVRQSRRRRRRSDDRCCRRPLNQMRISPLEARAIAEALRRDPTLRGKLPAIRERVAEELTRLADTSERQSFDCPLLDDGRCLVHTAAKPIGCLAWHAGKDYSKLGWDAFRQRDEMNDALYGPNWQFRVIPLWLKRVLGVKGAPRRREPTEEVSPRSGRSFARERSRRRPDAGNPRTRRRVPRSDDSEGARRDEPTGRRRASTRKGRGQRRPSGA